MAKANEELKNNDDVAKNYEKAIELEPENKIFQEEYESFKAKITNEELETIIQEEVGSEYSNLVKKGDNFYIAKKYKEAIEAYSQAIELTNDDETTFLKLANLYRLTDDTKSAETFYKRALFVKPDYPDAWFNLGLVYANRGDLKESRDCFDKAIKIDAEYTYAYYALGMAYELDDEPQKAISNYEKYLNLETDEQMQKTVKEKIQVLNEQINSSNNTLTPTEPETKEIQQEIKDEQSNDLKVEESTNEETK